MMQAQIFTLYPELFPGPLNKGLYGKALSNNIWNLKIVNIRDYSSDKHTTLDGTYEYKVTDSVGKMWYVKKSDVNAT